MLNMDIFCRINEHELTVEKQEEDKNISGYRIVDVDFLLKNSMFLQSNHNQKCTGGTLQYVHEKRSGLVSTFTYKCNMCNKEFSFATEDPQKKTKSVVNTAAVWGTLSTGSTYAHLSEFLSVLDIPRLTRNMFYELQRNLGFVSRLFN